MRLLHTKTFGFEPFHDAQTRPPYAVLSHTWAPGHLRYSDLATNPGKACPTGPGSLPVRGACDAAHQLGLEYIWAESVCVDASSTAEVSEAVNSAFCWFQQAAACLVYLVDFPSDGASDDESLWRRCKWWTRAWTLPELLAPSNVRLYDEAWNFRGTKTSLPLLNIIHGITNISEEILCDSSLIPRVSMAKRMSWASNRKARRPEDRAYSLLGIFGVHMQVIYGEGAKSFLRLQEKIIRDTRDTTILAWEADPQDEQPFHGLFAGSPSDFSRFTTCPSHWCEPLSFEGEIQSTNKGLSITGPFTPYPDNNRRALLLNLGFQNEQKHVVALTLYRHGGSFVRAASNAVVTLRGTVKTVPMNITARRDLDVTTSTAIAETLIIPRFARGVLAIPSAIKAVPRPHPGLVMRVPLGGPVDPVVLVRRRGSGGATASIESFDFSHWETSSESYVFSHGARSLASVSLMSNAQPKKRELPSNVLPDRQDKRARTGAVALHTTEVDSNAMTLSLKEGDSEGGTDWTGSQEDLSIFEDVASEPPPRLEEGHPFVSITDDLTRAARAEFAAWQSTSTAQMSGTRFMACPFWARDRSRHDVCLRGTELRHPDHVKRHVWQAHRLPNYCPVCYKIFDTASSCNAHIVRRTCELQARPPHLEGVSEDQKQQLAKRDRVSASREDKWLSIWAILFPDQVALHPSPFPDGEEGRRVSLVREFWDQKGQLVVSGFLRERGMLKWEMPAEERSLAAVHALVLGRLVESTHNDEEEWEMIEPGNVPASGAVACPAPPKTLVSGLLPGASVLMLGTLPSIPGASPAHPDATRPLALGCTPSHAGRGTTAVPGAVHFYPLAEARTSPSKSRDDIR